MSKDIKTQNSSRSKIPDFEHSIMEQVTSGKIVMRPKWYFIIGSISSILGMVGLWIGTIFLLNISFFFLRSHGPMASWRLEMMLSSFPWWIPLMAVCFILLGIWSLKRFDFSYRKNFFLIVSGFIGSLLIASILIEITGISDAWVRRGPMRRYFMEQQNGNGTNDYSDWPRGKQRNGNMWREK